MVQRTATWNETDHSSADAGRFARDEEIVRRGFWTKARKFAAQLPFAEDLLAAYYCAFDRDTPLQVKAALIGALAYFVLPFDAVPDFLLGLGYTDDAAVLLAAFTTAKTYITEDHRAKARAWLLTAQV